MQLLTDGEGLYHGVQFLRADEKPCEQGQRTQSREDEQETMTMRTSKMKETILSGRGDHGEFEMSGWRGRGDEGHGGDERRCAVERRQPSLLLRVSIRLFVSSTELGLGAPSACAKADSQYCKARPRLNVVEILPS